jgi:RIO kinase 3
MSSAEISNKVYNKLRSFAKNEVKRQHRLKDKEEKATMETSVDANARIALFKWINQGIFDRIYGVIATGKESAVLHAVQGPKDDKHFAVKVYKTTLSEFKNRGEYVKDDFRFKNPRGVLKIWAEREFMNLKRMTNNGLPCPEPIKLKKNILAMTFIGENGEAAPRLRNVDWDFFTDEERTDFFLQTQTIIARMYKECRLVHGDLSEFNLLLLNGKVYAIDVSQAMDISHPRHLYFLSRDIENVLEFFANIGTLNLPTAVTIFNEVTGLDMKEGENLSLQAEAFSVENRTVTQRNDKQAPADMDLRLYNAEKPKRGESPARAFN